MKYFRIGVCLLLMSFLLANLPIVKAQSDSESYSEPQNLSGSGGNDNPQIVLDSNGVIHLFWTDLYAGLVYTRGDGSSWEVPKALNLPFSNSVYKLLADQRGRLIVFWVDENNGFFVSSAIASNASSENGWQPAQQIARGVVGFDVSISPVNQIHVVFALADETYGQPAGIYYTQTLKDSISFSTPIKIYQSKYFRTLLPPPGQTVPAVSQSSLLTKVSITSSVQDGRLYVYIGWEDRPLKRAFYAILDENGNWSEPISLDSAETLGGYQVPRNVFLYAQGKTILQLWDLQDQNGPVCTQHYKYSDDGGISWKIEGDLWREFGICPEEIQLINTGKGFPLFFVKLREQIFLMVWDGSRFSLPENQIELSAMVNPKTLDAIDLGCQKGVFKKDRLYVVGCDQNFSGDIWVVSRYIEFSDRWFGDQIKWSSPSLTSAGSKQIFSLLSINIGERYVIFWSGTPLEVSANFPGIYTLTWDGNSTFGPYELHQTREGRANWLSVQNLTQIQRIVLVWQAGMKGEIYYSWAGSNDITNPANWSDPNIINGTERGVAPLLLKSDPQSHLTMFFVIPYNENRGVYLIGSEDGATSWGTPQKIIGVNEANCEGFGDPQVEQEGNEYFYLTFTCSSLPGGAGVLEYYGSRSTDGGKSWSAPQLIVEGSVKWSKIFAHPDLYVLRLWNQDQNGLQKLWFSLSRDRGASWSLPVNFLTSESPINHLDAILDQQGGVHLLINRENNPPFFQIEYLYFNGSTWQNQLSFEIRKNNLNNLSNISAQLTNGNLLNLLVAMSTNGEHKFYLSQLRIEDLPINSTPQFEPEFEFTVPTVEVTVLPVVTTTPTPTLPIITDQPVATISPTIGIVVGGILSLFLVIGTIVIKKLGQNP